MKGLLLVLVLTALSASLEAAEEFRQVEKGVYVLGDEKDGNGEPGALSNLEKQGWRRFTLLPDEKGEVALWPGGPRMEARRPLPGLVQGSIGLWDVMLAHYQPQRAAVPQTIIRQYIEYVGNQHHTINFIRVVQTSGAPASIACISGGVGRSYFLFELTSQEGEGFQFSVDIWGR